MGNGWGFATWLAGTFEGMLGQLGQEMCMAGDGRGNVEGVLKGEECCQGMADKMLKGY